MDRDAASRQVAQAARERLGKTSYPAIQSVCCQCDGGVRFLRGNHGESEPELQSGDVDA